MVQIKTNLRRAFSAPEKKKSSYYRSKDELNFSNIDEGSRLNSEVPLNNNNKKRIT
jgi:hypothetical protein